MILRFLSNTLALAFATWLLPGIALQLPASEVNIVVLTIVAVIFGAANSAVKPRTRFSKNRLLLVLLAVSLPVANAALLLFISWVCAQFHVGWHVDSIPTALLGCLILTGISFLANWVRASPPGSRIGGISTDVRRLHK